MAWLLCIFLFGVYLASKDSAAIIASAIFGLGGCIRVAAIEIRDKIFEDEEDEEK